MGDVILGMPGPWANNYLEASDHYTTKIGGRPDWPSDIIVRPDLLKCTTCREHLYLVAQIYAPVSSKILTIAERVIYIFGCVKPECGSNSWRALHVQKSISSEKSNNADNDVIPLHDPTLSHLDTNLQKNPWTIDSEEDDEIDIEELGRAFTEAASLASHTNKRDLNFKDDRESLPIRQTSGVDDNKIPVLPCFYIYTQEEKLSKAAVSVCSINKSLSMKESKGDADDPAPEEIWEVESYEYDRALNADRTYLKFKKRVDMHPEQCFRYSYNGKPLLATGEAGDPGTCVHCHGLRHFELQLMPPLLYFLQEASDNSFLEHWNWMTLIVYTCSEGCLNSSSEVDFITGGWIVAEEAVVVQHE